MCCCLENKPDKLLFPFKGTRAASEAAAIATLSMCVSVQWHGGTLSRRVKCHDQEAIKSILDQTMSASVPSASALCS